MTTPPNALTVQPDNIPAELRELPQWVCWHWTRRDERWTKVPIDPHTGRQAKTDTSATWGTFDQALARYRRDRLAGVGFVFSPGDPYCGIDLDSCRDPTTEAITAEAHAIIAELDGYAEISPSRTGVKIFIRATLPNGRGRRDSKQQIEMYDRKRFFTMTGAQL